MRAPHSPSTPWPTLVLAAGLGTRLRPLTHVRAKAAIPVSGVPLIVRILRWVRQHAVRDIVVNLHHLPSSITTVLGDGSSAGLRVRYSWEQNILGSAGGPRHALPLLDAETFFLLNGDTLTDVDLTALAHAHGESNALVTMALLPNPDPVKYGGVTVDAHGAVTEFSRRGPDNRGLHFIGIQAVEAGVFRHVDPDRRSESVMEVYAELIRSRPGRVRAMIVDASFRDIGTVSDYVRTNDELVRLERLPQSPFGERTCVSAGALVDRSILWDDVTVEDGCELVECVVADGARIPAGGRYRRRTIRAAGEGPREPGEELADNLLIGRLA